MNAWTIVSDYMDDVAEAHSVDRKTLSFAVREGRDVFLVTEENAEMLVEPSGMVVPPDGAYCGRLTWKQYYLLERNRIPLLAFWLVPMPGCCAVCIATYVDGPVNDARADLLRQQIARYYKYSLLLCSNVSGWGNIDIDETWEEIHQFGNDRYHKKPTSLFLAATDLRRAELNQQSQWHRRVTHVPDSVSHEPESIPGHSVDQDVRGNDNSKESTLSQSTH